jgi:hypothetical protein
MDTDRQPATAVLQSEPEVISPVRAKGEGTTGTIQWEPSNPSHRIVPRTTPRTDNNLGPSAATSSENFHDTSSLQNLTQSIQRPSVHLSESRRETKNDDEIDWIGPKEEKVSNVLVLKSESCQLVYIKRRVKDLQSENVCNLPSILLSLRRTNVLQKPGGPVLR